tara:strand:+ start:168 stop:656 length:489 start_codon:yes stop_codon:yes gene_type:complete
MSYIGQELGQGKSIRSTYTAVGGETSVDVGYTPGQLSVFLNGVKLVDAVDYTATTGTNISGLNALTASDVVDFVSFEVFLSSDVVAASTGGTFNNRVTFQNVTDNPATLLNDITAPASYSTAIIGPVTVPNLTVNGNLTVMTELNVTGNTSIASAGQLNIIG